MNQRLPEELMDTVQGSRQVAFVLRGVTCLVAAKRSWCTLAPSAKGQLSERHAKVGKYSKCAYPWTELKKAPDCFPCPSGRM